MRKGQEAKKEKICDTCNGDETVVVEVWCREDCKEAKENNEYHSIEIDCPCCQKG